MTPQVYSGHVPDDVGGTPFQDGWMPDDHDRGMSDEEFAAVVFDEAFIKAAAVHEPTAVERLLAAAQGRAEASEAEARRAHARGDHYDDRYGDGRDLGHDPELDDLDGFDDDYGPTGHGKQIRWHRAVAWLLALVMGIGMVALAFAAVYRGASSSRQDPVPPPATTGVEQGGRAAAPSASAYHLQPTASAVPRTP
ncbi:hypothetical protein ACFXAZ_21225 [Streptomyces sp. NPDC059477]|uniref:SCO2584 family spore wall biosynthesis protein n=1 Tax=Streptomyces sp. NPDC059477 TaxID=3346847 RepID=UPI00369C94F1